MYLCLGEKSLNNVNAGMDAIADFDITASDDGAGTVIIQLVRGTV